MYLEKKSSVNTLFKAKIFTVAARLEVLAHSTSVHALDRVMRV